MSETRIVFAKLSVDEDAVCCEHGGIYAIGTLEAFEEEMKWAAQSGIEVEDCVLSDEDDELEMARYCRYLFDWAFEHCSSVEPSSPKSFDELLSKKAYKRASKSAYRIHNEDEWNYLISFVRECDFRTESECSQLRCLWTAYCFHQNLDVDTRNYDVQLWQLWELMRLRCESNDHWHDQESFDNYLCVHLV